MSQLRLERIRKGYGGSLVLPDLSLDVAEGELLALLGPSGCGKTTTLRTVAGFERVEGGRILIGAQDVTAWPARKRDIGVVFQSYALFPHMNVAQNVSFGLKMRGETKDVMAKAVREALALVRLQGLEDRLPRQLSGGQQQRVAVARAIAIRPRLLLLDEPLSNLDSNLRDDLREEFRRLQRLLGITTVFVTHDQSEALAMSDRVAVMNKGCILQIGAPDEIYERPANTFVAGFIGRAAMLRGTVLASDGQNVEFTTLSGLSLHGFGRDLRPGSSVVGVVKTERIRVLSPAGMCAENEFCCRIESTAFFGSSTRLTCLAGSERIEVVQNLTSGRMRLKPGDVVRLGWSGADCVVLPDDGVALVETNSEPAEAA